MNAVPPDPSELRTIKRAFRLACIAPWIFRVCLPLSLVIALLVGITSHWIYGVVITGAAIGCLITFVLLARCPRCGSVWESEELYTTLICRNCRVDIRRGLRGRSSA